MNFYEKIIQVLSERDIPLPKIPDTPEEYAEFQLSAHNNSAGKLNETDGIDCPECLNRGTFLIFNKSTGEFSTKICSCMQKRYEAQALKNSSLNDLLNNSFDNFQVNENWQRKAKNMAIEYSKTKTDEWFFIGGQSGAGKTHLCTAISKAIINQGKSFKYLLWGDVSEALNRKNSSDYFEMQKIICNKDVIYIDDFLKPIVEKVLKNRPFSYYDEEELKKIYPTINKRYFNGKKTIISSELYISEIRDLDEATAGRIKQKAGKYIVQIARDPKRNFRFNNIETL